MVKRRTPLFFLSALLLFSCSLPEISIEDTAKRAALLASSPILEKIFDSEAPISPSNRELYPTIQKLPGKPFNPKNTYGNRLQFLQGWVELPPGDYLIPVLSYCMKNYTSSPLGHRYLLGKLSGRRAAIIRDLNARALLRFQAGDVQAVSWSIQSGVPYDEMPVTIKKIVDSVIPEHSNELKKSFLKEFSEKWDGIAEKSGLPRFDEVTEQALSNLGELGEQIRAMKNFRTMLQESGGSYETLRLLISLPGNSDNPGTENTTPWSKVSENIYARFLIDGHFLDVGELQVRVIPPKRRPQVLGISITKMDIPGLVADPGVGSIQPLSFSPLQASAAIPLLAMAKPEIVAAFLAALIAAEYMDWEAVGKAIEQWGASTQKEIKGLIDKLRQMYSKEFGDKPGQVKNPPSIPLAFPGLARVPPKTPRGGGKLRMRWKDAEGNIYEWDYQHGRLEKYDKRGNHQGEYDPDSGEQTKQKDPTRKVEP